MCQAFSCLLLENGKVVWEFGVDSHEDLIQKAMLPDDGRDQRFVRVEIAPRNGDYINPDEWAYKVDQEATPAWYSPEYAEMECRKAWVAWEKKLRTILPAGQKIVHPFRDVTPPKKITKKHLDLLRSWARVGDSVWDSVWASVGDSVWASVRASVWAYCGSFFSLPRKAWKHTDKIPGEGYPFQPAVDLWHMGLVPSFDGKTWRLHGGPKGEAVWAGTLTADKEG